MSRNGSGVYNLPTGNPVVTGTIISSSGWANPTLNDIAAALTQSISRDGQSTPTANLPMGNFNFTGMGAPTGSGQALRWEQLTKGADIASAASISIPNEGAIFDITGTTGITALTGSFLGRVVFLHFLSALTLTNSSGLLLPNGKDLVPYPGEVYGFCNVSSGVWECVTGPSRFAQLWRSGGTLTATSTAVTVAPGQWRSAGDETNITLNSAISKTLQTSGAWAAGSGSNGLFTGAASTNWYHVFVIKNDTTGAVDAGFDTSVTAANKPAGWSVYRRVGSVFNQSGTGITPFVNTGNIFYWFAPFTNIAGTSLSGTATNVTVSTPPGVNCLAFLTTFLTNQSADAVARVFSPSLFAQTGSQYGVVAAGVNYRGINNLAILTNTASQVVTQAVGGTISTGFFLNTDGYTDFLKD